MQTTFRQLRYCPPPAAPEVADLVDGLFTIENPTATPQPFTVLPDGYVKLLLTRRPDRTPQLTLSGVRTHSHDITIDPHSTVVGIRFHLLAAEYILPGPPPLNGACSLPLDHWLGDILLNYDLPDLARHLARRLAPLPVTPRQRVLFAALSRGGAAVPVAELAAAVAWSPRQLNRYFHTHLEFLFY